jgi:hydroxymethylbilane synthase
MTHPTHSRIFKIGTRGSPLALAQTHELCDRLKAAHGADFAYEICEIKTSGDKIQDRALIEAGGKGLFTKELEEALLDGRIDIAVHSMKDMQATLPDGLVIGAILPREDVRDAFISLKAKSFNDLPEGAVLGTASIRRQAYLLHKRPDLKIVLFRGNVQTRLRKLADGEADATLLAVAGLKRLGLEAHISEMMPLEDMLPAPAQGAIGLEVRAEDERVRELIAAINHEATAFEVEAERAFLITLDGSCRTPIAALARLDRDTLAFKGAILSPDGSKVLAVHRDGAACDARALGVSAAEEILSIGGNLIFGRKP